MILKHKDLKQSIFLIFVFTIWYRYLPIYRLERGRAKECRSPYPEEVPTLWGQCRIGLQCFGILPFDPGAVFPECFILLSSFCLIAKLELGLPLKPESPSHLKGSLPHKTNLSFYIIESDAVVNQSYYLFSRRLFSTDEDDPEHSGLSCTMQEQDQEMLFLQIRDGTWIGLSLVLVLSGKRWHFLVLLSLSQSCVNITNTFGPRPLGKYG